MGSPRTLKLLFTAALLTGLVIPVAVASWNRSTSRSILDILHKGDITGIRVWGAGIRTGDSFCGCAMVRKPERIYYETSDPAEIRQVLGLLRPRLYLSLDPPTENCGQVTIDFLRRGKPFWIHLKGQDLRSAGGELPITSGSRDDLEAWLKRHSVREKIRADLPERK